MIDLQKKIVAHLDKGAASKLGLRMALMCSSDDLEAAIDKLESLDVIEAELVGNKYLYSNVRHVPAAENKEANIMVKTIKDHILDLFGNDQDKALKAADIADLLPEMSNSGVKTTVYKMAQAGELFKKGNFFFLPIQGGAIKQAKKPIIVDQSEYAPAAKVEPVTSVPELVEIGKVEREILVLNHIEKVLDASVNMAGIISINNGASSIKLTKAEFKRVADFVGGVGA